MIDIFELKDIVNTFRLEEDSSDDDKPLADTKRSEAGSIKDTAEKQRQHNVAQQKAKEAEAAEKLTVKKKAKVTKQPAAPKVKKETTPTETGGPSQAQVNRIKSGAEADPTVGAHIFPPATTADKKEATKQKNTEAKRAKRKAVSPDTKIPKAPKEAATATPEDKPEVKVAAAPAMTNSKSSDSEETVAKAESVKPVETAKEKLPEVPQQGSAEKASPAATPAKKSKVEPIKDTSKSFQTAKNYDIKDEIKKMMADNPSKASVGKEEVRPLEDQATIRAKINNASTAEQQARRNRKEDSALKGIDWSERIAAKKAASAERNKEAETIKAERATNREARRKEQDRRFKVREKFKAARRARRRGNEAKAEVYKYGVTPVKQAISHLTRLSSITHPKYYQNQGAPIL